MKFKTFTPLNVSSKFAICGVPLRVDTYKTCDFGCKYCFSNYRKVMEFEKTLQIANLKWLENKCNKVYVDKNIKEGNFLETLMASGVTWHWGGMSDPFQHVEKKLQITKQMVDIANKHNVTALFSTKSDTVNGSNIRPDLHTFQLSVTNNDGDIGKVIEPNVPSLENRYKFYKELKKEGFKVGIRIQPCIPGVTNPEIIDLFHDADHITIEGLKLVPQNKEHKDYLLDLLKLNSGDFKQMGLLNLKPEIRQEMYKPFLEKIKKYGLEYSIADNDMHHLSSSDCCCGDSLIAKSTTFNNTYMTQRYGTDYTLEDVKANLGACGGCVAKQLFTSNRQEGCTTVEDFYDKRFDRKSSPFSPKFLYLDE